MTTLDMDQGLIPIKGSRASLETIWKRYVEITQAISKVSEADWESGKKPVDSEIISVYGGKSQYYGHQKVLKNVQLYPDMIEWLERSDLDLDMADKATSLWGYFKASYTLKDLEKWLVRKKEIEVRSDQKGKKKETVQAIKQKGKKNDDDDDDDSSSPPRNKRIHKKSVGGRK